MLTGDLAISVRRGDKISPRLIKTGDANNLRDAANLIEIFDNSIGKTRGEIEAEFEEYVGTGTDYKVLRGFIKLLTDRAKFQTESIAEPQEIRRALFLAAKSAHPVLANNRTQVLDQVAADFNCRADEIESGLYADLSAQQRLLEFDSLAPVALLDRYNLAQAQALLYRCGEMRIRVEPQTPAGYRQIFSAIKYYKLIHTIAGNPKSGYTVTINGAASLFHRSQKYGINMAVFLPVLLNCAGWRMAAEIDAKNGSRQIYELDSAQKDLRSHLEDEPEYQNPVHEKLVRDWAKHNSEWQLEANREVVNLGKIAFVPDFVVERDNKKVYVEILGFWTPNSLQKRLDEFKSLGFDKFIVAAWEELRGSRDEFLIESPNVLLFKSRLEPRILELAAEKVMRGEQ